MKPERLSDYRQQIPEASYRRLTGELSPHPTITCDAANFGPDGGLVLCGKPAICGVGTGTGHPSCEQHARGEDHVWPLNDAVDDFSQQ